MRYWQAILGLSAAVHLLALGSGLAFRCFRYPTWLALCLLSGYGALTWNPRDPVDWVNYLLLFLRMAAALEAALWLVGDVPAGARKPLAAFIGCCGYLALWGMWTMYPASQDAMSGYLFLRGLIHTLLAVVGFVTLAALWSEGITVDRHALVVTVYLAKFSACQLVQPWLRSMNDWILVDTLACLTDAAILFYWAAIVARSRPRLA